MARSVGPFLFWVFLGQLCRATCLLQGCYLVLMRKCVPLLWRFPLSPPAPDSCRPEGKMEGEAPCPIAVFSCALNDSSTETLKRKLFCFVICDIMESKSNEAPSWENAYFLQCISHRVSSFVQRPCKMLPHLQRWNQICSSCKRADMALFLRDFNA